MIASKCTAQQFEQWAKRMGWDMTEAAAELGTGISVMYHYRKGSRSDNPKPVVIPKTVALAMAALENKLKPIGG